jgi:adenosylcobinamide-GDP ribazoletransferase
MIWDGFKLAVSLLSAIPMRAGRVGEAGRPGPAGESETAAERTAAAETAGVCRRTAGAAMAWAPAVGLILGGAAAAVAAGADRLLHAGPLLAAALAIATLALLTRGLHLDGLADLADGLGSGKPAPAALEIMKRSDIGPFGVAALVLTLLVQVAALAQAQARGGAAASAHGSAALVAATVTGRLAITWACRRTVPAARPHGLGALVAGTLPAAVPATLTVVALGLAALCGWLLGAGSGAWLLPTGIAAGLAASFALTRHAVRRFGGITGDVLGALAELATTVCLIVTAA